MENLNQLLVKASLLRIKIAAEPDENSGLTSAGKFGIGLGGTAAGLGFGSQHSSVNNYMNDIRRDFPNAGELQWHDWFNKPPVETSRLARGVNWAQNKLPGNPLKKFLGKLPMTPRGKLIGYGGLATAGLGGLAYLLGKNSDVNRARDALHSTQETLANKETAQPFSVPPPMIHTPVQAPPPIPYIDHSQPTQQLAGRAGFQANVSDKLRNMLGNWWTHLTHRG